MLKFMRTHATSWIIKILLGLIIVVFALYWGGQRYQREETVVATVGDYTITKREYDRTYNELVQSYRKTFGQQIPPDFLKKLKVKDQSLDQLINLALFIQEGQRVGFEMSEKDMEEAILQSPIFQRDGRFDPELYLYVLRSRGLDSGDFQEMLRKELVTRRMGDLIGDIGVILSEDEITGLFLLGYEEIDLDFIKVAPGALRDKAAFTQRELEGYYTEHSEQFRTPPQVKVVYLRFSPDKHLMETTVSPQEVKEYYDMNIEQYRRPKKVRVRHILVKVNPEAGPAEVTKARKKAEMVVTEARRGTDFTALARKYSEDPSGPKGGDLGYFAHGEMDPDLERAVAPLRKGEISSVVRTRYGFHIVKVEDVQGGTVKTEEEMKEEIVSRLKKEKAKDMAAINAEDAAYRAKNKQGLRAYAKEEGLALIEAGPFRPQEHIQGLGASEKFSSVAFTLEQGDISSAFQNGDDYFVLQVVEKMPPQIPPLQDVQKQVKEGLISSLAKGMAQSTARDLLKAWREGKGFQELVRKHGLQVEQTGYFKRGSASPPRIGPLGTYAREVVVLTPEEPWSEEVAELADAYYVIKLRGMKEVNPEGYKKDEIAYRQKLSYLKGGEFLQRWLLAVKKKTTIDINQKLLEPYR